MYIGQLIFRLNSPLDRNLLVFSSLKISSGTFFLVGLREGREEFFDEALRAQNEKVWLFLFSDRK